MKKELGLFLITNTLLYATNGDLMVGHGSRSMSMAGVGIATTHGAESALINPAMIKDVKNSELSASVTIFSPSVKFGSNAQSNAMPQKNGGAYPHASKTINSFSTTKSPVIPNISYAKRLNPNTVVGLSVNGTAGLGADYNSRKRNGAFGMNTALKIMKVSAPTAYTIPNTKLTVAVAPMVQYSTLNINYTTQKGISENRERSNVGYGVQGGIAYKIKELTSQP